MTGSAQIWIHAARPKTLGAAVAPVVIGTGLAYADRATHWPSAAAAMLGAMLIQIGTNFCNDYCDFKKGADKERIGPVRATQAGLVSPRAMLAATVLAFSLCAVVAAFLFLRGGWPIAVIGAASISCGALYTAGPFPLGYLGLGDLFVLIFFGPVAVAGTYYVQAFRVTPLALWAGVAPGLLAVGILVVNNLRDMETDARVGKKTLAVRFGNQFARLEYGNCIFLGTLWPVVLVKSFHAPLGCVMGCFAIVSAYPSICRVFLRDGAELNPALGGTSKVLIFYSLLFFAGCILTGRL